MIPVPAGVRVWLATGVTDMRRGMNTLALQVQEDLGRDPHAGDLYIFRGRRGDLDCLHRTTERCAHLADGHLLEAAEKAGDLVAAATRFGVDAPKAT